MSAGNRKHPYQLHTSRPPVSRQYVADLLLIAWLGLTLGVILGLWFGVL